jgi:uncharacterized protein (DUF58 family)
MKRLYVILIIIGVALYSAMATGFTVFYILLYALIAVLGSSLLWGYFNLAGLNISARRQSGLARVGDEVETELYIRNKSPLPKLLLEIQDMQDLPGLATGTMLNLGPFQTVHWTGSAPLLKRGVYALGPVRAYSTDLFGLFRFHRTFGRVQEIVVYPTAVDLPLFQLSVAEGLQQGVGQRRSYEVTPSVSTLREYVEGDSLRRIHWPSTLRTNKLMVKQFDADMRDQVWIILDLQRNVQAGGEIENTAEVAITAAASLSWKMLSMDRPVGLIAQGDQYYLIPPQRSATLHQRLLGMLATAQAEGTEPLSEVIRRIRSQLGVSSSVIVITPSLEPLWVQALDVLVSGRTQTAVVLLDAASFGGTGDTALIRAHLQSKGATIYVVRRGQDLSEALDIRGAISEPVVREEVSQSA